MLIQRIVKSIEDFEQMVQTSGIPNIKVEKDDQLESILECQRSQKSMIDSIDKGLNVLFDLHKSLLEKNEREAIQEEGGDLDQSLIESAKEISKLIKEESATTAGEEAKTQTTRIETGSIDILMRVELTEYEKELIGESQNLDLYEMPLVNESKLNSTALYMMRMLGRKKEDAAKDISDTITLIKSKTAYRSKQVLGVDDLIGQINHLAKTISG